MMSDVSIHSLAFRAMGTQMLVCMDNVDDVYAQQQLSQVPQWFERWESVFSRFRSNSELSVLNASAGQSVVVSDDFWQVLQLALHHARASDGVLTPAIHDALCRAGYRRSFEALSSDSAASNKRACDTEIIHHIDTLVIDDERQAVCLPLGMRLDLSGFVKGWCADQVVQRLGNLAPTLMDAGGDVAISGVLSDGSCWEVAVAQPYGLANIDIDNDNVSSNINDDEDLCVLRVPSGAVATSGRDYRVWQHDGKRQHHLIDPRTGESAQTEVLTATVVASSVAEAEAMAKLMLILGREQGLAWMRCHVAFALCLVFESGEVWMNELFEQYRVRD